MLLFQNTHDKKQDETLSAMVVSSRSGIADNICSQLEIRGIGPVERHQTSFAAFDPSTFSGKVKYFIFDIENSEESDALIDKVALLVSREVICIAIGDRDSIVLARKYQSAGIHYIYNDPDELSKVGDALDKQAPDMQAGRSSLKICVLGCKGGVGNSSLSYHLANSLIQQRNISLLMVQGLGGTHNLDLIAKKEISTDVTKIQESFYALYEQREHGWDFTLPLYDNYDFVLFDHTLYNADTSEIENALQHANSVILVCNSDLASIRNAKKLLEHHQHAQSSISRVKKIIICFNENQPKVNGAVTSEEAGGLIGQPVDIVIPYIKGAGDPAHPLSFSGKNSIVLQQLTNLTLGRKVQGAATEKRSGLLNLIVRKR